MNLTKRTFHTAIISLVLGVALCLRASASLSDTPSRDYPVEGGCVLRADAYVVKSYPDPFRYNLEIVQPPKDEYHWDFTFDESPNHHYNGIDNGSSSVPHNSKEAVEANPNLHKYDLFTGSEQSSRSVSHGIVKEAILYPTLHQFDILEERVTFRNLRLSPPIHGLPGTPLLFPNASPRYLILEKPVTVTLPAQGLDTLEKAFFPAFNGNANALFIQIRTSPNDIEVCLPKSPLYKKHQKPVRIKLETVAPYSLTSYMADNTYSIIAISHPDLWAKHPNLLTEFPNEKTMTSLDTLTLIIRQRVDLKSIPITLRVPISPVVRD